MFKLSHIIAGLGLLTLSTTVSFAQTTPPARTYFKDDNGNETRTVHERWFEDANGEKHGKYIEYIGPPATDAGKLKRSLTYVHGRLNGPAIELISTWGNRGVGTYTNGVKTGVWSYYGPSTSGNGKLSAKMTYDSKGNKIKEENFDAPATFHR